MASTRYEAKIFQLPNLSGKDLKRAFAKASLRLGEYRETINNLNVFPVPDGDTGTNMLLTMQAAMERCPDSDEPTVAEVASQLAEGAFFGARGNSGVILSQFFKGLSDALQENETSSVHDLAYAFDLATKAAYSSVATAVEGTMLTVIRQAAEAVKKLVDSGASSQIAGLWETAFLASREALKQTPEQLPVLREAGVVDSGGFGMVVILGGGLEALVPDIDVTNLLDIYPNASDSFNGNSTKGSYLPTTVETKWGYCTEFIINGEGLTLDGVRRWFQETALSTVVAGDDRHVRVHIHVEDPGPALSYAVSQGIISDVKIESMDRQILEFASESGNAEPTPLTETAVLAVTSGKGLAELFRDSGCAALVDAGTTMNPNVKQILEAAERARAKRVIVLPNNQNILLAAQQAAASNASLQVVASTSIPQGVAALLAYNADQSLEDNLFAMKVALTQVSSIAVTRAARDTTIGDVAVASGEFIGLLENDLAATGRSPEEALAGTLALADLDSDAIVTIYRGCDTDNESAERFAQSLEQEFPGIQVDRLDGGQPNYHYLASVE